MRKEGMGPYEAMPGKTRRVKIGGEEYDAEVVPVNSASEHFNEYLLDDQTVLRMKIVLTDVSRVKDLYDQNGNPVYQFNTQNVIVVDAPDSLKREPPTDG